MVLSVVLMGVAVALAEPLATLEAHPGSPPAVTLKASSEGVVLAECRGVSWEAFVAAEARYVPLSVEPCDPAARPAPIGADGVRFEAAVDLTGHEIVRAVVVVAQGCAEGQPLAHATCTRLEVVEGPTIQLRTSTPADGG